VECSWAYCKGKRAQTYREPLLCKLPTNVFVTVSAVRLSTVCMPWFRTQLHQVHWVVYGIRVLYIEHIPMRQQRPTDPTLFDYTSNSFLFIISGVEALRYKTKRSRVRFPMVPLESFIDLILPAAPWPWGRLSIWHKWVPGISPGGKGGRCVRLTTVTSSRAECLEILVASISWRSKGRPGPDGGLVCLLPVTSTLTHYWTIRGKDQLEHKWVYEKLKLNWILDNYQTQT